MKSIYKIFILLMIIGGVSLFLNSCKKTKREVVKLEKGISIDYSYEDITNSLKGNKIDETFYWNRESKLDKFSFQNARIFFDLSSLSPIEIISKTSNSMTFKTEGKLFRFENVKINGTKFQGDLTGESDRTINFKIDDKSNNFNNAFNNFNVGQKVHFNEDSNTLRRSVAQLCPWCAVYGIAVLIGVGVDYYCDRKIVADVKACTEDAKCSKINSCSATCVECGPEDGKNQ